MKNVRRLQFNQRICAQYLLTVVIGITIIFNVITFMVALQDGLDLGNAADVMPSIENNGKSKSNGLSEYDVSMITTSKMVRLPDIYLMNTTVHRPAASFLLRPEPAEQAMFMIFFVKSACHLTTRRKLARQTWGSVRSINNNRFSIIFLLGSCNQKWQNAILQEQKYFKDILQSNVGDDYSILPEKVLSAYQWLSEEVKNISEFYGFTDDDCMIKILDLYKYFSQHKAYFVGKSTVYCGFAYSDIHTPCRDPSSKYYIPFEVYDQPYFPTFCHGGLTLMTYEALRDVYEMSMVTNRNGFHLEDVYITGILRAKSKNCNILALEFGRGKNYTNFMVHLGNHPKIEQAFEVNWMKQLLLMTVHSGSNVIPGKTAASQNYQAVIQRSALTNIQIMKYVTYFGKRNI